MHARRVATVRIVVARARVRMAHRVYICHLVLLLGLIRALLLMGMQLLLMRERRLVRSKRMWVRRRTHAVLLVRLTLLLLLLMVLVLKLMVRTQLGREVPQVMARADERAALRASVSRMALAMATAMVSMGAERHVPIHHRASCKTACRRRRQAVRPICAHVRCAGCVHRVWRVRSRAVAIATAIRITVTIGIIKRAIMRSSRVVCRRTLRTASAIRMDSPALRAALGAEVALQFPEFQNRQTAMFLRF